MRKPASNDHLLEIDVSPRKSEIVPFLSCEVGYAKKKVELALERTAAEFFAVKRAGQIITMFRHLAPLAFETRSLSEAAFKLPILPSAWALAKDQPARPVVPEQLVGRLVHAPANLRWFESLVDLQEQLVTLPIERKEYLATRRDLRQRSKAWDRLFTIEFRPFDPRNDRDLVGQHGAFMKMRRATATTEWQIQSLHTQLCEMAALAWVGVLRFQDTVVSVAFFFRGFAALEVRPWGFDTKFARYSPGSAILFYSLLAAGGETGANALSFGVDTTERSQNGFKTRWADAIRQSNVCRA